MSATDQVGLADELIDATGLRWMIAESLVPRRKPVALDIGERPAFERNDELVHIGMIEVAADEFILLVRASPPAHHLRRPKPALYPRKIGRRHRAEGIGAGHGQLCRVSMVTLRLVKTQMSAAMSSERRTIASASLSESIRARAAASA